jgi:hypothetical protein
MKYLLRFSCAGLGSRESFWRNIQEMNIWKTKCDQEKVTPLDQIHWFLGFTKAAAESSSLPPGKVSEKQMIRGSQESCKMRNPGYRNVMCFDELCR